MDVKGILHNTKEHGIIFTVHLAITRQIDKNRAKRLSDLITKSYSKKGITDQEYLSLLKKMYVFCSMALENPKNPESKVKLNLLLFEYQNAYKYRPFKKAALEDSQLEKVMQWYFETEEALRKGLSSRFKDINAEMKATYVKTRFPAKYNSFSKYCVEQKIVFMENGNCPSPSNGYLIKTLREQNEYKILTIGLHRRAVSELEYYENAFEFIKEAATAKAIFLTTANDLLSWIDLRPETKLIQLWHGVGMFKKVGWSTVDKQFGNDLAVRKEYDQYRNYSYVTIAGKEQAWTFEDAMHIPVDSGVIVPVGISRTDVFYDEKYLNSVHRKLYETFPQIEGKKIILYAPTFRGSVRGAKAPDQLDIDAMGNALSDKYVLLIKHHGLAKDVPPIPEKWNNTFAFDMGANKILGIEQLLAVADICISDYSSVAFEYAILERPLIFFAYDINDYLDARGMYYDYEEITPGPVCKITEEMIDYILHLDERFNKQDVIDFKNKYVEACDGHATERTIALIEK